MNTYADIVPLGTRIGEPMTYRIPEDLLLATEKTAALERGTRVLVPLGPRWATGVVVNFRDTTDVQNVRDIGFQMDPYPALPDGLLRTCEWLAGYYQCTLSEVLGAALPAGIHTQSEQRVSLGDPSAPPAVLNEKQQSIIDCLEANGPLSVKQLERRVGPRIRSVIHALCRSGRLQTVQEMRRPRTTVKTERYIQLVPEDPQWMESQLPSIERRAPRQAACLSLLRDAGGTLPSSALAEQGIDSSIVRRLVDRKILKVTQREIRRDPYVDEADAGPEAVTPTTQQAEALEIILKDIAGPTYRTHLISGVTGSGKTLIYIKAVKATVAEGRGAIVLIPEISLTPQTVGRFRSHFGDDVAVLHSGLSEGERYDAWRDLREGRKHIVVGARSAIFAPTPNLGLIVIDEEHDGSYKQDNPAPRYNAKDVAVIRGQTEGGRHIESKGEIQFWLTTLKAAPYVVDGQQTRHPTRQISRQSPEGLNVLTRNFDDDGCRLRSHHRLKRALVQFILDLNVRHLRQMGIDRVHNHTHTSSFSFGQQNRDRAPVGAGRFTHVHHLGRINPDTAIHVHHIVSAYGSDHILDPLSHPVGQLQTCPFR